MSEFLHKLIKPAAALAVGAAVMLGVRGEVETVPDATDAIGDAIEKPAQHRDEIAWGVVGAFATYGVLGLGTFVRGISSTKTGSHFRK